MGIFFLSPIIFSFFSPSLGDGSMNIVKVSERAKKIDA